MAYLYIEEFTAMGTANVGQAIQAGYQGSVARQRIAIAVGSTASAAFNAETRFVRLHADAACCYVFGTAPTAVATDSRLPADGTEYFSVAKGTALKVANIAL